MKTGPTYEQYIEALKIVARYVANSSQYDKRLTHEVGTRRITEKHIALSQRAMELIMNHNLSVRSRKRENVVLRHAIFYVLSQEGYGRTLLGKIMGNYNHATVIHGIKACENSYIAKDKEQINAINYVRNYLKSNNNE